MDFADQLQKLEALRAQGVLTEEEFSRAKARVLDGTPRATAQPAPPPSALNRFHLSRTDKWIGGVCGGLAELSSIPSWSWRILFLFAVCLHGIGLLLYILLWIFVPVQLPAAAPTTTSERVV